MHRLVVLLAVVVAFNAEAGPVDGGKIDADLRYRLESVRQAGFADDALASTVRLRLGYLAPDWNGVQGYVGFETIHAAGDDRYNSSANGRTQFPVVADPEDSEVDQAWLGWSNGPVQLRVGRQRINLDNQRFVGAVGFRQNEQTFEAATAQFQQSGFGEGSFFYGYLRNADRVFGEHHPDPTKADLHLNAHLLNYTQKLGPVKATPYAYWLELKDTPAKSHRNLGLRIAGEPTLAHSAWQLQFAAEYARQSGYADAPAAVAADYWLVELGLKHAASQAKAGYEILGGDGSYAFATPLATLHAFNGWADRFLTTPATGLRDAYIQFSQGFDAIDLKLVFHDFRADSGASSHYGTEWDAAIGVKTGSHSSVRLEYADYRADSFATSTRIVWFTVQAGF